MNFETFRKYNPETILSGPAFSRPMGPLTAERRRLDKIKLILDANINGKEGNPNFKTEYSRILMVKATHSCNLNCPYCYDIHRAEKEQITMDTVKKIVEVFSPVENMKWTWHGGEPTLIGKDFIREANRYIKDAMPTIKIGMQTNGSLLDEEWLDIFDETGMPYPGISYDGLGNDSTRGTTEQVLKLIELYQKRQRTMPISLVVTKNNVNNLIAEHEYAKTIKGAAFRFSVMNYTGTPSDVDVPNEDDIPALVEYFKYWAKDPDGMHVNFGLGSAYTQMVAGNHSSCTRGVNCRHKYYGIEPNGDIVPCGRPWPGFGTFGNIHDYYDYRDIKTNCKSVEFNSLIDTAFNAPKCVACKWHGVCAGDCMNTRHVYGDVTQPIDSVCNINKALFETIYEVLQDLDLYSDWRWNPAFINYLLYSDYLPPKLIENTCRIYGLKP